MNLDDGPVDDTVAQDMKAFGVRDFEPPAWMVEPDDSGDLQVLPENLEAVHTFLACSTQWHRGPKGEPLALRYDALHMVMDLRRVADAADVFSRVQVMEQAALREFARQRRD